MIKDIFLGITGYFRFLPLVSRLKLWKFFIAPIFIGVLLIGLILTSAIGLGDDLGLWITGWYRWDFGAQWIASAGTWIGGILIFVLGIILSKYIVIILASPFMSPMSQKIASHHIGDATLPTTSLTTLQGISRGLRIAAGNLFKELFITAFLLILTLFLPFISPVTAVLIFLLQAYYAGGGNMDYTLERYYDVSKSKQFVKANRGLAIGNGIVFVALLMLGLGFFIAPPLGTLAITSEVLDRIEK